MLTAAGIKATGIHDPRSVPKELSARKARSELVEMLQELKENFNTVTEVVRNILRHS